MAPPIFREGACPPGVTIMRCAYISTVLMSQAFFIIHNNAVNLYLNNFVQNHLELVARVIQYTQFC